MTRYFKCIEGKSKWISEVPTNGFVLLGDLEVEITIDEYMALDYRIIGAGVNGHIMAIYVD